MDFRITGLPAKDFRHLFGLPEAELARLGARRVVADASPGFPDRVELRDADPGESLILVNFEHQAAPTPYRASHAIFVLENAGEAWDRRGEIPDVLARRTLSLRAFDAEGMMVGAELVEGCDLVAAIEALFADPAALYIHVHYAKRGCYAARIDRA